MEKYPKERIKHKISWWYDRLPEDWQICVGFMGFILFCNLVVCLASGRHLTLFFFIEMWIYTGAVIFLICTACFIASIIKNKAFFKSRAFYFSWILSFILALPTLPFLFGYGTTQIGDFYEKKEYREDYIVEMSREPETNLNRKEYTLPATIRRNYEDYIIEKLYFPNGGYLTFSEQDYVDFNTVLLDEEVTLLDSHDNT